MSDFFAFEADFVESLRCIPMQVRFKLDTCGVKLKLHQWNQFDHGDRARLVEQPCDSPDTIQTYRADLHTLIVERTGETATDLAIDPAPPWLDATTIPDSVQHQAQTLGVAIAPDHWAALSPLQRFALIKLSRSHHENSNFLPALREFGVV